MWKRSVLSEPEESNHGDLMRAASDRRLLRIRYAILAICCLLLSACQSALPSLPRFGTGGRYLEGKEQFLRGRGGDMDKAIVALESVVREDPTYRDSLTLLGRAYYSKGRYEDASLVLQRALAVNKDDEIAWLVLGLTQLRLGQGQKAVETVKGAITLVSKVSKSGYRDYPYWDRNALVRSSIQRTAFLAVKGVDEKDNLIQAGETLLFRMDDEENSQRNEERKRWDEY